MPGATLSIKPIKLFGTFPDDDAMIVSQDECMVAILLRLSYVHDDLEGRWFVEWGSRAEFADHDPFGCLDDATTWLSEQIGRLH